MERIADLDEKVRRAEEIFARRNEDKISKNNSEIKNNKDIKVLKKIIVQLIISVLIGTVYWIGQNNQEKIPEEIKNKINECLAYDINFNEIYSSIVGIFQPDSKENEEENNIVEDNNTEENNIGGAENSELNKENLSQEETDVLNVKNTTSFIKPVNGSISSVYGQRNPTTSSVPKNHTGIDIAANLGEKIVSATDGEVVLKSEEGDYGKHLKIQIGEVSIIYAHCNNMFVNLGDKVVQGQEIAEVGTTGNSTGPHLHFEVRINERTINPQSILDF